MIRSPGFCFSYCSYSTLMLYALLRLSTLGGCKNWCLIELVDDEIDDDEVILVVDDNDDDELKLMQCESSDKPLSNLNLFGLVEVFVKI